MIEIHDILLPHGITLRCHVAGPCGAPVLVFLHGFPEAAFIWDGMLAHFSHPRHGGYRCIAPDLRGFGGSSQPEEVEDYRMHGLVQDVVALIAAESPHAPLAALVAHDWGGAVAWSVANQRPERLRQLIILNAPHPGAFVRELKNNAAHQAASAYMHDLIAPGAEDALVRDDFAQLWSFFLRMGAGDPGGHGAGPLEGGWLTEAVREQYRAVWRSGLRGACNYYRATPVRPPRPGDLGALAVELPPAMLHVDVPTFVLWGMGDTVLLPTLLDGLDAWVPRLVVERIDRATHWIVHEQPRRVMDRIARRLQQP